MEHNSREDRSPDQCLLGEIKQLMTQQKVSQAELAKRIEVSASLISQVFNGRKRLTSRVAKKILKALGSPHQNIPGPSPKKRPGRKRGSGYDCRPHLRFMAHWMVQVNEVNTSAAAKEAITWATKNGHAAVSWETLRTKFGKNKKELLKAERSRLMQRRAAPSSYSGLRPSGLEQSRQIGGEAYLPSSFDELETLPWLEPVLEYRPLSGVEEPLAPFFCNEPELLSLKQILGAEEYSKIEESVKSTLRTLQLASDPDFDPFDPFDPQPLYERVEACLPKSLRTLPPESPQIRQLRGAISQRAKELRRFRELG